MPLTTLIVYICLFIQVFSYDPSEKEWSESRVYIFDPFDLQRYPTCFGTLVSYKHVLTASECVARNSAEDIMRHCLHLNFVVENSSHSITGWR